MLRRVAAPAVAALLVGGLAACGSSGGGSASGATGNGGTTSIKFGDLSPNANLTPVYVAAKEGFFKKNGLDVTIQKFTGGGASSVAALATGAVQVSSGGSTNFLGNMAKKVIQGKIIGETIDQNYDVLASKNISSISDLKGKVIGISGASSADQIYLAAVLQHYGIGLKDVTYLTAGTPPERVIEISTGKINAIAIANTQRTADEQVGNILLRSEDSPVKIPGAVFYASDSYIKSNTPALKSFIKSVVEATARTKKPANLSKAVADCESGSGATADQCKETIDFSTSEKNVGPYTWSSTYAVNTQGMAEAIKATAVVVPEAKSLTVNDVVDTAIAGSKP